MFGKPFAQESCAFAVFGKDADRKDRTVDLEADTPAQRDRWVCVAGRAYPLHEGTC
jgi:hypothetical protein